MLRDSVPPPLSIVPADPLTRLLQQSRFVTSIPLKTKLLFVVRAPLTLGEIEALLFGEREDPSALAMPAARGVASPRPVASK